MNKIYTISSEYNGLSARYIEPIRVFKGMTDISYDIEGISSGNTSIIKIIADFNDGTELLSLDYSFINQESIKIPITHRFKPSEVYQFAIYYPTIFITFSNFTTFVYQTPLKIAKESFYSEYERLDVASCQFIDNAENSMFVIFDTGKGDILNLKIK